MIATNLEQSKELLRLGLPAESADMCWCNSHDVDRWFLIPRTQGEVKSSLLEQELDEVEIIPAWSLSALLEVMPKGTELIKMQNNVNELYYEIDYMYTGYEDSDPITAAYEMVCWLLEQGLIKKKEQDGQ